MKNFTPRLKTESQINAFNQERTLSTISHKLVYTVMAKSFEKQKYRLFVWT